MKKILSLGLLSLSAVLFSACSTTGNSSASAMAARPNRPVRLQMTVSVPASMNLLREEDVAEAFAYRVSSSLHEQGLRGRIHYVELTDEPVPNVPTLDIMLHEWRVDGIGNVDCTFSANLKTSSGSRDLGIFTGTSMMLWSRMNWMDRQRGFEDAAHDALSNLARRITQSGLLPDMQQPAPMLHED